VAVLIVGGVAVQMLAWVMFYMTTAEVIKRAASLRSAAI